MKLVIDDAVFDAFPELRVGVVGARGIDNRATDAAGFLATQVDAVRVAWSLDRLAADPRILAWREAYRAFGAKPKKHRSSVENLIRTILERGGIPSINPIVDVYNAISLQHGVPIGGDDLDRVVGDIRLTLATGHERFVPLNGTEPMPPKPGEVVYCDDEGVLCRRWNWRECDRTKMTADAANVCLVVEGLPPVTADDIERAAAELAGAIEAHCGGRATATMLDRATGFVDLGT